MANDATGGGHKFVAWGQVLILAALLAVGWQVRAIRADGAITQTMTRTTEWTTESGKVERFQSFRESGESFDTWRFRHTQAVRDLGGEQ
jgi:hypothetical protein